MSFKDDFAAKATALGNAIRAGEAADKASGGTQEQAWAVVHRAALDGLLWAAGHFDYDPVQIDSGGGPKPSD